MPGSRFARSLRPTRVFDTYWRFAAERQEVYYKRLRGMPPPWTDDPIIREYKFTNAYRAADRVSQYLIRHVIYASDQPDRPEEVLFRILLFKLFNKIETWQLLTKELGDVTYAGCNFSQIDRILTEAMQRGTSIYSAAYIMPSVRRFSYTAKHRCHLALLEMMMRDSLCSKIGSSRTMKEAFELLRSYPSIGTFLAYQLVTDINYSELTNFTEVEFVAAGPGAKDGIRKAFENPSGLADEDVIRCVTETQDVQLEERGVGFRTLFGRPLQLIDCQNLFCEVGKYARVAHPEMPGISGRSRIKQRYSATGPISPPWFPPKWGINDHVENACVGD